MLVRLLRTGIIAIDTEQHERVAVVSPERGGRLLVWKKELSTLVNIQQVTRNLVENPEMSLEIPQCYK